MNTKFRAWDKRDKEMYFADEINFNYGEPEYNQNFVRFTIKGEK